MIRFNIRQAKMIVRFILVDCQGKIAIWAYWDQIEMKKRKRKLNRNAWIDYWKRDSKIWRELSSKMNMICMIRMRKRKGRMLSMCRMHMLMDMATDMDSNG